MNNEWLNRKKNLQEENELRAEIRQELEVEFNRLLEEGYEQAYQILLAEQEKSKNLEAKLCQEFDEKLRQQKEYIVDKVDQYLNHLQRKYECTRDELTKGKSPTKIVEEALKE